MQSTAPGLLLSWCLVQCRNNRRWPAARAYADAEGSAWWQSNICHALSFRLDQQHEHLRSVGLRLERYATCKRYATGLTGIGLSNALQCLRSAVASMHSAFERMGLAVKPLAIRARLTPAGMPLAHPWPAACGT